jgi:L-amino acid N-acyltransferase YncA
MTTSSTIKIEDMKEEDWLAVKSIYIEGIETKNATFETEVPEWNEWEKNHLNFCRFVAFYENMMVGWAALSPVSGRYIYSGVTEVSLYVTKSAWGKGIGKTLLNKLIETSEKHNIWTLQAGVFPQNESSIILHKKAGFREVGYREKIGQLDGVWRDVILLERRTKIF